MSDATLKRCFVVGPIGADDSATRTHADWLLDGVILPVFAEHFKDFDVKRSDRISEPGMIDSQMINRLLDDELVIADLSELNANAFYEIGIRHMAQKPIIHMFLAGTKIPFDVSPYRAIAFSTARHRDVESAKVALKAAVEEALSTSHEVENPVTRARGTLKIKEHATPEVKILLERIEALENASSNINYANAPKALESMSLEFSILPENGRKFPNNMSRNLYVRDKLMPFGLSILSSEDDLLTFRMKRQLSAAEMSQLQKTLSDLGAINIVFTS